MANTLNVQGTKISVIANNAEDYICLTDMAGAKRDEVRAADVIKNWLRNRYTIEFLGTWSKFITRISKWSNLTTLECKPVYRTLF